MAKSSGYKNWAPGIATLEEPKGTALLLPLVQMASMFGLMSVLVISVVMILRETKFGKATWKNGMAVLTSFSLWPRLRL